MVKAVKMHQTTRKLAKHEERYQNSNKNTVMSLKNVKKSLGGRGVRGQMTVPRENLGSQLSFGGFQFLRTLLPPFEKLERKKVIQIEKSIFYAISLKMDKGRKYDFR